MLGAVDQLRQALRVEADDEILSVRDHRHAHTAGQGAPFPELENVFRDVRFLKLTAVFSQPILGESTVGSSGRRVDFNISHEMVLACESDDWRSDIGTSGTFPLDITA